MFSQPRTFLLDASSLAIVKNYINAGQERFQYAYRALIEDAEKALHAGPFSVMHKTMTPPSGDKHDFYNLGTYWWPDPAKPDGLPYIRKDGEVNPETRSARNRSVTVFLT